MDIILLFLAKPLDKHGTTLVHITYPPLDGLSKHAVPQIKIRHWAVEVKKNAHKESRSECSVTIGVNNLNGGPPSWVSNTDSVLCFTTRRLQKMLVISIFIAQRGMLLQGLKVKKLNNLNFIL